MTAQPHIERTYVTKTGKRNKICLVKGDIAKVNAQALMMTINSSGMWWGAIDGVIERACGVQSMSSADQFHQQLARAGGLQHGKVFVCRKQKPHQGLFDDVIWIIDDLQGPVDQLTFNGLKAASDAGYEDISLPAYRTATMKGVFEPTPELAVAGIFKGIHTFYEENPDSNLSCLTFVIYDGGKVLDLLKTTPLIA